MILVNPYTYASTGGGGATTDPFFSDVTLLVHANSDFSDSSSYARTPTLVADAAIDNTNFKYGAGAGAFDGSADRVSYPVSGAEMDLAGDFTVEAWVRFTAAASSPWVVGRFSGASGGWALRADKDAVAFIATFSTGTNTRVNSPIVRALNTWFHVAATRSGSNWTLWVDGVSVSTLTDSSTILAGTSTVAEIGGSNVFGTSATFKGQIDDVRVTNQARYSSTFTPPTAQFPDS